MSEKKRKAISSSDGRPKKKHQTTQSTSIEHILGTGPLVPIIATTPGTSFPHNVKFQAFSKKTAQTDSNLLIHTSDHPTIDFTAVEGTDSTSSHLKHYVAVYDASTNSLKLTGAKALTVRSSLRPHLRLESSDDEDEDKYVRSASRGTRTALTEAFGSKKSKKAVQSMLENRQLGQGGQGATIAEALIAGISSGEEEEPTDLLKATAAAAMTNKPLPRPDLTTSDIDQVYSLSSLVVPSPASTTLAVMPISLWTGRLKANKEITNLRSRFVANRISYLGRYVASETSLDPSSLNTYTRHLQVLRYIELLIEIAQFAAKFSRTRLPFVDKWPEGTISNSGNLPSHTLKELVRHFFPNGATSQHNLTLLRATILALTLHIPPPSGQTEANTLVCEPTDIQLDLALDIAQTRKYFHELGCKVSAAKEKELSIWGYQKILEKKKRKSKEAQDGGAVSAASVPKPVFAVLRFPLDFPKVSTGKRAGQGIRR